MVVSMFGNDKIQRNMTIVGPHAKRSFHPSLDAIEKMVAYRAQVFHSENTRMPL